MRHTFLFVILLFSIQSHSQQGYLLSEKYETNRNTKIDLRDEVIYRTDSTYCYYIDTLSGEIIPREKSYHILFNENHQLLETIKIKWNSDSARWENNHRTIRTYTPIDFFISEVLEMGWDSVDWKNIEKMTFEPNENGNSTETIRYIWNSETENWDYATKQVVSYFAENSPSFFIQKIWNPELYLWQNDWKISRGYNPDLTMSASLFQKWDSETGVWKDITRSFFTYDENGILLEEEAQVWHSSTTEWRKSSRFTYENSDFGEWTIRRKELWDYANEIWVNLERTLHDFNADNLLEYHTAQNWIDEQWVSFFRGFYSYDENGKLIKLENQRYAWNDWQPKSACEYYYTPVVIDDGVSSIEHSGICTISNPYISGVPFYCDFDNIKEYRLQIFSQNGIEVFSRKIKNGELISIDKKLSSGIYFFTLSEKSGIFFNKKIIFIE